MHWCRSRWDKGKARHTDFRIPWVSRVSFSFTYICTSVWPAVKTFPFVFERLFSDKRSSFHAYPLTPSLKLSSLEDVKPFLLKEPARRWTPQTERSDGMVSVRMSTRPRLRDTLLPLSLLLWMNSSILISDLAYILIIWDY